jgi:hypothetical protein
MVQRRSKEITRKLYQYFPSASIGVIQSKEAVSNAVADTGISMALR